MKRLNKQQLKNKPKSKRVINWKRIAIIAVTLLYVAVILFQALKNSEVKSGNVSLLQFYDMIDNNEIEFIDIDKSDKVIKIYTKNNEMYETLNPDSDEFIQEIMERGVEVKFHDISVTDSIVSVLTTIPITIFMAMIVIYLASTLLGASTKMFTLIKNNNNYTTFDDIRGMEKTKSEIQFIIQQLKNWKELGNLGARPCKGILLFGPPGVGKTLIAKAIAKESGLSFISCSGSDFDEVFVGVGASRVRSLFELASTNAPCVVFIDEIDCLGRRRRGGDGASQDHNQTLNALLQKMDGLNEENGIIVIGATNRKEDLDEALTRPGRFDRQFYIGKPDTKKDRDEIVDLYINNKKLDENVTLENISKLMIGLSGAEIEEALNSAVFISLQNNRKGVLSYSDIDEAIMQIHTKGTKYDYSSEKDRELVSVHEAGHTLVSLLLGIPVAKVSNIPYNSGVGGITLRDYDIEGERKFKLESDLVKDIKILLGGKCAEDIIYDEHSQGCCNDIEQATKIVYNMVTSFANDSNNILNENVLINENVLKNVSEETLKHCNELLSEYNDSVMVLLRLNRELLVKLYKELLDKKTIVEPTLEMLGE